MEESELDTFATKFCNKNCDNMTGENIFVVRKAVKASALELLAALEECLKRHPEFNAAGLLSRARGFCGE